MAGGKAKISSKSKSHPGKGKGMGTFFYDSEEGTVFGRTAASWLKITVFYIIFYACLAGFFYLNYYIFSYTLNDQSPKWTQEESLIGANPGIGFRPKPDEDTNSDSTLIWYKMGSPSQDLWTKQLQQFVENSNIPDGTPGVQQCSFGNSNESTEDKVCKVEKVPSGPCARGDFGYTEGTPCVLIKLNKIYGWKPEPFGVKDGKYDPELLRSDLEEKVKEGMPMKLRDHIMSKVTLNETVTVKTLKTVWISCSGENVGDKESIPDDNIKYYPETVQGIQGYYFPYSNQKSDGKSIYRSPYLMVNFNIRPTARHVLINIECRAWAKNTKYDKQTRLGSVHFELMVDDK